MCNSITSNVISNLKEYLAKPGGVKKAIFVALSVIMALGMILAYSLGAPWFVIAGFFLFSLFPLFPLGKAVDEQKNRINS